MRTAEVLRAPPVPLLRRERRTENRLAVAAHDLDNCLPGRNRFVGGRQAERTSRRRHLTEEPLDTGGTEEKQHPRLVGVDVERVADALRRVQERARYAF